MKVVLKTAALAVIMICANVFSATLTGHSGMMKLMNPETHGSGYFSLNISTLLGAGAESPKDLPDSSRIVYSSSLSDYFQSTSHLSINVSLGNYLDFGGKVSFAVDSRKLDGKNYKLNKVNNVEVGLRTSFKRTGFFRAGMYLYGQLPVLKKYDDIEEFTDFTEFSDLNNSAEKDSIRYYNHRKFSDEFLYNPMASFGGKLMTSMGNEYFRVILNGGYLWRTAEEKVDENVFNHPDSANYVSNWNAPSIKILPDAMTFGAGMDIYLSKKARFFIEWDGELLPKINETIEKSYYDSTQIASLGYAPYTTEKTVVNAAGEEFIQRLGGGFKFIGNENFSATVGGFFSLEDAPKWQVYTGITFSGNFIDPDTDKDGVINKIDQCPNTPLGLEVDEYGCPNPDKDLDKVCDGWVTENQLSEQYAGVCKGVDLCPDTPLGVPVEVNGCPIPDEDGDGVCDPWVAENNLSADYAHVCKGSDQCPGTLQGLQVDEQGCPNADKDGDGICDPWVMENGLSENYEHICIGSDKCPDTPRGILVDSDGCPNVDRDGDGICDPWIMDRGLSEMYAHICVGSDKCPDVAETFNGFEDEDGCPDAIILKKDQTIVLDNIYFRLGSADLEPESFPTLNALRRVFIDNPGIVVQIEGHTDSQGSDEYNLRLSQQRADTVRNYIIDVLGISRDQVSSVGYGEARPVATNQTSAGRAQNRRIEFRVISTR